MIGCLRKPRAVLRLASGVPNDLTFQENIVSIAPMSSSIGAQQPSAAAGAARPVSQDVRTIATAPAAADLARAKEAFAAIRKVLEGSESGKASQSPGSGDKPGNQLGTDLAGIGKALMAADLGAVQNSVKGLLGDIQAAHSRYQSPAPGAERAAQAIPTSTRADSPAGSRPIGSRINTTA
jgi:hypothetical protein